MSCNVDLNYEKIGSVFLVAGRVFGSQGWSRNASDTFYGSCNTISHSIKRLNQAIYFNLRDKKIDEDNKSFVLTEDKINNLNKLHEIELLEDNWNGNNAQAFSKELISKVKNLIYYLDIQPEVFPLTNGMIQIEYDGNNDSYLEFEIGLSNECDFFQVDKLGKELSGTINSDIFDINRKVEEFYE